MAKQNQHQQKVSGKNFTQTNPPQQPQNTWQMPQDIETLTPSQINIVVSVATEEIGTRWYKAMTKTNKILDGFLMVSFIFLLFVTTCFAVFTVAFKIVMLGFLPNSNSTAANPSNDTNILVISEYIFLSLLPIFIVFGFFNYYKNNTRIYLTGIGLDDREDVSSTKMMDLTKKLFISSVISYIMIKIIEVVFRDGNIETSKIIAASFLLSILMIYSILLNKFHK